MQKEDIKNLEKKGNFNVGRVKLIIIFFVVLLFMAVTFILTKS